MPPIPVFRHPSHEGVFITWDKFGIRTIVRDSDSFGLNIIQTFPDGKKRRILYGNDQAGFDLYIHVLKFLLATRQKIPPFPSLKNIHARTLDPMDAVSLESRIEYDVVQPYPSTHSMEMDITGTVTPVSFGKKGNGLAVQTNEEPPVLLSSETIHALARAIPKIFIRSPRFRYIHTVMSRPAFKKQIKPMQFIPLEKVEHVKPIFRKKNISKKRVMGRWERMMRRK